MTQSGSSECRWTPLEKLNSVVPWEVFRKPLAKALKRSDGAKGGRPAHDPVMMFNVWPAPLQEVSDCC